MKNYHRMKGLIDAYCEREKLKSHSLRLMFKNIRITSDDTPCKLGIQEGDEIQAIYEENDCEI